MLNQTQIDAISGFHIEPTNLCTLKCSGCPRTRFINQWAKHWKNHSLEIDVLMNFLDVDLNNKKILMCGNYGDPIYHPELIELVKLFKQRGACVSITTNGSYRQAGWWEQLINTLDSSDHVVFSVDGTPENFTQYRVNADWNSIHTAMQIAATANCTTTWKYIPFNFNQHNIDEVRQLSQQIGIDNFKLSPSDRFDEQTQHLKPTSDLLGTRYNNQVEWKQGLSNIAVDAKCIAGNEHYISADGFYSPCCYVADHRFYYKNVFGKNKNQFNIRDTTLSRVFELPETVDFYQSMENQNVCQFNCPNTICPN